MNRYLIIIGLMLLKFGNYSYAQCETGNDMDPKILPYLLDAISFKKYISDSPCWTFKGGKVNQNDAPLKFFEDKNGSSLVQTFFEQGVQVAFNPINFASVITYQTHLLQNGFKLAKSETFGDMDGLFLINGTDVVVRILSQPKSQFIEVAIYKSK